MARQCVGWGVLGAALVVLTGVAAAEWLAPVPLSDSGVDSEFGLNHSPVVYDAEGGLHVAWADRDTPAQSYQIYARHRRWATWSSAELVVPYDDPFPDALLGAKYPSLGAAGDSLFMAWHDYRHGGIANAEIYARAYARATGAWQGEWRVTTTRNQANPGDNGLVPTLLATGDQLDLIWFDFRWDPNRADLFSAHRSAAGWVTALGDSADIVVAGAVTAGFDARYPALARAADGTVHAVWAESGPLASRLRHARRQNGAWLPPHTVVQGTSGLSAPTVAVDPAGTVHMVWRTAVPGGATLRTVEWDGFTYTEPTDLVEPGAFPDEPCLAAAPDGTLHLVWHDARLGLVNREVWYRSRPPAGAWPVAGDRNISEAEGRSDRPTVVADAFGHHAVVWRDDRSGVREIWLREFRGDGRIGVATPSAHVAPRLVVAPNPARGRVVVAGAGAEWVEVYDARGACVYRLAPGERVWTGARVDGRRLAAGAYLFQARPSGRTAKVVYVP